MANNPRQTPPVLTRKHQDRLHREQRQVRIIRIATVLVLALVILLIGYGILDQQVLRFKRAVAVVNGERISAEDFRAYTKYYRSQMINQAQQTYQFASMFGSDPTMLQNFASQLQSINASLDPETAAQAALDAMVDNVLIIQEAQKQGITVSEDEIDAEMQEAFGYFANGTPTPTTTKGLVATSTLSPTQLGMLQPTATEGPTEAPTAEVTAEGTEAAATEAVATEAVDGTPAATEAVATEAVATEAGPTGTPTPSGPTPTPTQTLTPTPYTFEGYQGVYATVVADYETQFDIPEETLRYVIMVQLYRDKMQAAVIGEVPCEEERVWAQHILVGDAATAQTVKDKLAQGEDWYALASEYSTDTASKESGGDVGWFARTGQMVEEFSAAAFDLGIGEVSEPVQSQFGFHIIRVLGHENQPLTTTECERLKGEKFDEWVTTTRDAGEVEQLEHWRSIYPLLPTMPADIQQAINSITGQQAQPPADFLPTP